MDTQSAFLNQALAAFLRAAVLGVICYALVSIVARFHATTGRGIYLRRLVLLAIVTVLWWFYLPAFLGYGGARQMVEVTSGLWGAKQLGLSYGMNTIWAWVVVALIDRPKLRPNNSLQATAAAPSSYD
jgi:hypothetical protein